MKDSYKAKRNSPEAAKEIFDSHVDQVHTVADLKKMGFNDGQIKAYNGIIDDIRDMSVYGNRPTLTARLSDYVRNSTIANKVSKLVDNHNSLKHGVNAISGAITKGEAALLTLALALGSVAVAAAFELPAYEQTTGDIDVNVYATGLEKIVSVTGDVTDGDGISNIVIYLQKNGFTFEDAVVEKISGTKVPFNETIDVSKYPAGNYNIATTVLDKKGNMKTINTSFVLPNLTPMITSLNVSETEGKYFANVDFKDADGDIAELDVKIVEPGTDIVIPGVNAYKFNLQGKGGQLSIGLDLISGDYELVAKLTDNYGADELKRIPFTI